MQLAIEKEHRTLA